MLKILYLYILYIVFFIQFHPHVFANEKEVEMEIGYTFQNHSNLYGTKVGDSNKQQKTEQSDTENEEREEMTNKVQSSLEINNRSDSTNTILQDRKPSLQQTENESEITHLKRNRIENNAENGGLAFIETEVTTSWQVGTTISAERTSVFRNMRRMTTYNWNYTSTEKTTGIPTYWSHPSKEKTDSSPILREMSPDPTVRSMCPHGLTNTELEFTCSVSEVCQYLSYGCDIRCPENGNLCFMDSCVELQHCVSDNYYRKPLPNVCNRNTDPDIPCPPLCMCIGVTVNMHHYSYDFSLIDLPVRLSGNGSRFPDFLKRSSIRYLILTDVSVAYRNLLKGLNRLSFLDMSKNKLSSLSGYLFHELFSLETLNLSFNRLEQISGHLFHKNTILRILNLSHNKITVIPEEALNRTSVLMSLDLSHNKISHLANNTFSKVPDLQFLDLSHNVLVSLPENIFHPLPNLWDLRLNDNEISELNPNTFLNLYYITTLDLSNNALNTLPDYVFYDLFYIEKLHLANNRLTVITQATFFGLEELAKVDLSGNAIGSLSNSSFASRFKLKELYLNRNNISSLHRHVFKDLHELSKLDMADNRLSSIPRYVFKTLTALKYLFLQGNKITLISSWTFTGLDNLSILDLSHNELKYISDRALYRLYKLSYISLENNQISVIPGGLFKNLSHLFNLSLSFNTIESLSPFVFRKLPGLAMIHLEGNRISKISDLTFQGLKSLVLLDMSKNAISELSKGIFDGLERLIVLKLDKNRIETLHENAFGELFALRYLDLNHNALEYLPGLVFSNMPALTLLDLSYNKLNRLTDSTFQGITSRVYLRLNSNEIKDLPRLPNSTKLLDISRNHIRRFQDGTFKHVSHLYLLNIMGNKLDITQHIFEGLDHLRYLLTDIPFICCNKPKSVTEEKCLEIKDNDSDCLGGGCDIARSDAISSCTDLISTGVLRVFLWVIGITALTGNVAVLVYRFLFDKENIKNTYAIFVMNLAVSDFLMGIYLAIIGIADVYYSGEYAWNDQEWRNSVYCTVAGILSFISSEMSTFLILLVTLDRLLVIVLPLSHLARWRISWTQAVGVSCLCWIVSITLAIVPVSSFQSYFKGEYYSQAGVCLALPLLGEEQDGAEYSFAVFVYLNSFIFSVIAIGQVLILCTIKRKTKGIATSIKLQREKTVAKTLFLVVATDFCCWFPVGVMGVMAKLGMKISDLAYAWVIVFVLPINSSVNPFLYTATAIWKKRRYNNRLSQSSTRHQRRQRETVAMETSITGKGTKYGSQAV